MPDAVARGVPLREGPKPTPRPIDPEHSPVKRHGDRAAIERFYDRCSDLMRELLDALAAAPDTRRLFPEVEDAIGGRVDG